MPIPSDHGWLLRDETPAAAQARSSCRHSIPNRSDWSAEAAASGLPVLVPDLALMAKEYEGLGRPSTCSIRPMMPF